MSAFPPNSKSANQHPQYGLRPPQVAAAIGSVELLKRARYHGWIKPVVEQKRLTIFDAGDVAALWQRIRNGDIPALIPRKSEAVK